MNRFKTIAIKAAIESGRYIKRSVGKISDVSYKGVDNIVTNVDRKAEEMIIRRITNVFPEHSVLSEERKPKIGDSAYKWIIDPLDGTTNFSHAFPFFCVSIALEFEGSVVLAVIYDPMRDELFVAEKGRGATLNKKRIRVSNIKDLTHSLLATGFSYGTRGKNKNVKNFRNFLIKSQAMRRAGSAALDLCYVACARFDGFWELGLHPWDSAAGSLIVIEAGGVVSRFDGSQYDPYDRDILASNYFIHKSMVNVLSAK